MTLRDGELGRIARLLEQVNQESPRDLRVDRRPLHGGLESVRVLRITARYLDRTGRRRVATLVMKQLRGAGSREAGVYRHLATLGVTELAPRLLALHQPGSGRARLYLEAIRPISAWPWREPGTAAGMSAMANDREEIVDRHRAAPISVAHNLGSGC